VFLKIPSEDVYDTKAEAFIWRLVQMSTTCSKVNAAVLKLTVKDAHEEKVGQYEARRQRRIPFRTVVPY